ncbi:MAG: hypothetical protein ACREHD_24975 [Pirellulales bacterium]
MKAAIAILIVAAIVVATKVLNDAVHANKPVHKLNEPAVSTLDVERPLEFLNRLLPGALKKAADAPYGLDARDGRAFVRIKRGAESVVMEVELITGTERPFAAGYCILFAGAPAGLDDTYALALRLCDLAEIPNDKIVAWYKEKKHENVLTRTQLQTGGDAERRHEIEVRSSLAFDPEKPWRVMYTIYFPGTEGGELDAHPEKVR